MSLRILYNSLRVNLLRASVLGILFLVLSATGSLAETPASAIEITASTDKTGYNVGETVQLQLVLRNVGSGTDMGYRRFGVTVHFVGGDAPLVQRQGFYRNIRVEAGKTLKLDYRDLWTVPEDAKTGLYEVKLSYVDDLGGIILPSSIAHFAVYRKRLKIESIELDKAYYTPGDWVSARIRLKNLTGKKISGLGVEFGDRHWPWIVGRSGVVASPQGARIVILEDNLELDAGEVRVLDWLPIITAPAIENEQPKFYQFGVYIWGDGRRKLWDLAFSPQVILRPPNKISPTPYHLGYMRRPPAGEKFDFPKARSFYPPEQISSAIQAGRGRSMYRPGDTVNFHGHVKNPTSTPWEGVNVEATVVSIAGELLQQKMLAADLILPLGETYPLKTPVWEIPADTSAGLYQIRYTVGTADGLILAQVDREIAVNPLPKSILVFCAHEDDESAHSGTIRAAVESNIPIRFVYFTSGDAGSCDRYYGRFCGPNEAREFGYVRMAETRRALAHLGVSQENIFFLGLPDGGSGAIWYEHIEPDNPYLATLMSVAHAPYRGIHRPNLPFARRAVVDEAKKFIRRFEPEVIYTGHPDERHVDHRTNNWFVVKALQELRRENAVPDGMKLLVDQVYGARDEGQAPYKYRKHVLYYTGEVGALRQEAFWQYQSQGGNRREGQRRNFSELRREENHQEILDWWEHEGWNER